MKENCDNIIIKIFAKLDYWLDHNNMDNILKLTSALDVLVKIRVQLQDIDNQDNQLNFDYQEIADRFGLNKKE